MPFLDDTPCTRPRYQPILKLEYDHPAKGFIVWTKKGSPCLDSFLKLYGQPLVARRDHFEYYVPEIYYTPLLEVARACHWTGDVGEFWQREDAPPWEVGVPTKVTVGGTTLRPYQAPAVQALMQGSLILGDDMGLGKTLSVLQAFSSIAVNQLIVIVPNDDVAGDWLKCLSEHFADCFTSRVITNRQQLKEPPATVTLIPYSKVWREGYFQHLAERAPLAVLVVDEGHRVSRSGSRQHRGVYDLACLARGVWILSGTEVSNTPDQYFGMYKLIRRPEWTSFPHVKPQPLGEKAWIQYFRDTTQRNQWNAERLADLRELRQGFALRRTKEEVQRDLPPLTILTAHCDMDEVTRKIYRDLERECEAELMRHGNPEVLKEDHFWVIYLRLIQLCSHPMLLGEERVPVPNKWGRMEEILDECAGSQQVGIWSNFPRTIEWLAERVRACYPWLTVETAHGGVSKEDRARIKAGVQAGEVDVFIANPAIWGEGVNLQAVSVGIYWDHHPSLVRRKQSQARFHRMGQTKAVTLYDLAYRNSVDTKLLDWLNEKGRLARLITGN